MFGLFKNQNNSKRSKVKGSIGFLGLEDWWLNELDEEKRKYILSKYQPIGGSPNGLIEGDIVSTSQTASSLLWGLGSWFNRPNDRHIGFTILNKALEEAEKSGNTLDRHFSLNGLIKIYYKDRADPESYAKSIKYCRMQIKMQKDAAKAFKQEYPSQDLPSHLGYRQLTIILDKENKHKEAIRLCEEAKQNEWNGDWDKRIARYKKKSE